MVRRQHPPTGRTPRRPTPRPAGLPRPPPALRNTPPRPRHPNHVPHRRNSRSSRATPSPASTPLVTHGARSSPHRRLRPHPRPMHRHARTSPLRALWRRYRPSPTPAAAYQRRMPPGRQAPLAGPHTGIMAGPGVVITDAATEMALVCLMFLGHLREISLPLDCLEPREYARCQRDDPALRVEAARVAELSDSQLSWPSSHSEFLPHTPEPL